MPGVFGKPARDLSADLPGVLWLTTAPSGRARTHGADDGQTGWRLHAVPGRPDETFAQIGKREAICGVRPGTGWGLDFFIERPCKRCAKKAGVQVHL